MIAVPSNNATFGRTDMTYQQLAMSRVRAVEHGRSVIVSATTGASAIIDPRGVVRQRTGLFTPAAAVAEIPVVHTLTPATRLGTTPEWVAVAVAAAALGFASGRARLARRSAPSSTRARRFHRTASPRSNVRTPTAAEQTEPVGATNGRALTELNDPTTRQERTH